MSKKIRVAWEDLQPGDLIHVKGSTNVYQFIRFTENKCQITPEILRKLVEGLR